MKHTKAVTQRDQREKNNQTDYISIQNPLDLEPNDYNHPNTNRSQQKNNYNFQTFFPNNRSEESLKLESGSGGNLSAGNLSIDKFKEKIKEQAHRLQNLEKYKILCEKKILLLNPTQKLPITEQDLRDKVHNYIEMSDKISYQDKKISELQAVLEEKESELLFLKRGKASGSNRSMNSAGLYNNSNVNTDTNEDFPPQERISHNEIRDYYTILLSSYRKCNNDKDMILESLRRETIANEEQKSYIELLKQTLESNILKAGLASIVKSQREKYYNNKGMEDIQVMMDIVVLENELDKYKKSLASAENKIKDLNGELAFIKKSNQDMQNKKEKIKETLSEGLIEIDKAKDKVNQLESEKSEILEKYNALKSDMSKEHKELLDKMKLISKYEEDLKDYPIKLSELSKKEKELISIKEKLREATASKEKLSTELDLEKRDKSKFSHNLEKSDEKLASLKEENKQLKDSLEELKDKLYHETNKFNREREVNFTDTQELEKILLSTKNALHIKEKEVKEVQEKYEKLERKNNEANVKLEDLTNDFASIKKTVEEKNSKTELKIKELIDIQLEKDKYYREAKNLALEKTSLEGELNEIKQEMKSLVNSLTNMTEQRDELIKTNKMHELSLNSLKVEKENLLDDLSFLKEKLQRDTRSKDSDIDKLNSQVNNLKSELNSQKTTGIAMKEEIIKKEEINVSLQKKLEDKDHLIESLSNSESDCRKKLENYMTLNKTLTELKEEVDIKAKLIERLRSANNENSQTIADLRFEIGEKDKRIGSLEDDNKGLAFEITKIRGVLSKTEEKTEIFYRELDEAMKINYNLDHKCVSLNEKKEDLKRKLDEILEEKQRLETSSKKLLEEHEKLAKAEKETQLKNYTLQQMNLDYKKSFEGLKSITKVFIHKFGVLTNSEIENDFSKSFMSTTSKLNKIFNFAVNEEATVENIKHIEEWLKCSSSELETVLKRIFELKNAKSEIGNKLAVLEKKLDGFVQSETEKMENDKKINTQIAKFNEDLKQALLEKENTLRRLEKINKEVRHYKDENSELFEANNNLKNQINKISVELDDLMSERQNEKEGLEATNLKMKTIEEELSLMAQEKDYYEELAHRLTKTYPIKEMYRVIGKVINIKDEIFVFKSDKVRLESVLNRRDFPSPTEQNEQVNEKRHVDRSERKKLQNLLIENERKTFEKQGVLLNLESEVKKIELETKSLLDDFSKNEFRIKELSRDLLNLEEEFNNYKQRYNTNAFSGNNVYGRDYQVGYDNNSYSNTEYNHHQPQSINNRKFSQPSANVTGQQPQSYADRVINFAGKKGDFNQSKNQYTQRPKDKSSHDLENMSEAEHFNNQDRKFTEKSDNDTNYNYTNIDSNLLSNNRIATITSQKHNEVEKSKLNKEYV